MNQIKTQSVVMPDKPMSYNDRATHILNQVLKSKGLEPNNN
jgi:hypothetical protein